MKNVLSFASLKKRPQVRRALGYVQYYYNSILFLFQEKIESNRINSALFFYDDYLVLFQLEL